MRGALVFSFIFVLLLFFGCVENDLLNTNNPTQNTETPIPSGNSTNNIITIENQSIAETAISDNNTTSASTTVKNQMLSATTIRSCPYTIDSMGYYVLDKDLSTILAENQSSKQTSRRFSLPMGYSIIETTLDETANKNCITVAADDAELNCNNHTISGNGDGGIGILLLGVEGVTIKNCIISDFNHTGIFIYSSNDNTLTNNRINSNEVNGIYVSNSNNNNFISNNLENNSLIRVSSHISSIGFYIQETSWYIDSGGIYLKNSSNNNFVGNNVTSNGGGIDLSYSNNNFLTNNHITNSGGVTLSNSSVNVLTGNNITLNYVGIDVSSDSSSNIFINNSITRSHEAGVDLSESNHNIFINNSVHRNWRGIFLESGDNNTFTSNNVTGNSKNDFECINDYGYGKVYTNPALGNICNTKSCYQWIKCQK